LIVHDKADTVGVIVVEGVKTGETLTGWLMEGDATIKVKAFDPILLGHKIAFQDIWNGDAAPNTMRSKPRSRFDKGR
jgi:(2R)-sulfolactate sulfo-lyase subunit alpha